MQPYNKPGQAKEEKEPLQQQPGFYSLQPEASSPISFLSCDLQHGPGNIWCLSLPLAGIQKWIKCVIKKGFYLLWLLSARDKHHGLLTNNVFLCSSTR